MHKTSGKSAEQAWHLDCWYIVCGRGRVLYSRQREQCDKGIKHLGIISDIHSTTGWESILSVSIPLNMFQIERDQHFHCQQTMKGLPLNRCDVLRFFFLSVEYEN